MVYLFDILDKNITIWVNWEFDNRTIKILLLEVFNYLMEGWITSNQPKVNIHNIQ